MPGRIVLFGATGYTGELTARALAGRGARPVLAARSEAKVSALADELGGLDWAVADVEQPRTVRALVDPGDVLVTTVGPFARWGGPALEAAIGAGAHYLDSTGETSFIRSVFETFGPRAEAAGSALLTAMGWDWVPGNLAAALALREAGAPATSVEVGYFATGRNRPSGGTAASLAGALTEPSFAWRSGRIVTERPARRLRRFEVAGKDREAVSIGTSEHLALPRIYSGLRDVDVYLGWFGSASRPMQAFSAVSALALKVPGTKTVAQALAGRFVKGSTGGPGAEARAQSTSHIVAEARDAGGAVLSEVRLSGVNGYDFTAEILAWAAMRACDHGVSGSGALGPVEAFGLDILEQGVATAGITRA